MNSKGIVALTDECVCMKCLKKKATHTYKISGRGYGSSFDETDSMFKICDECNSDNFDKWCNEQPTIKDYYEEYKYEDELLDFINNLPIQSQELFYNRFDKMNSYYMKSQDWIDYQLKELSHEKCKEYGLYSHEEIKAYEEVFPDGSSHCTCYKGAFGDSDGTCGINISNECYMCSSYKPRINEMKIVNLSDEYYKNEKQRLINMLNYANNRLEELEKLSVKEYIDKYEE